MAVAVALAQLGALEEPRLSAFCRLSRPVAFYRMFLSCSIAFYNVLSRSVAFYRILSRYSAFFLSRSMAFCRGLSRYIAFCRVL